MTRSSRFPTLSGLSYNEAVLRFKKLGIDPEYLDPKELQKAWHLWLLKNHPDVGGDPEAAQLVNEAYQVIRKGPGQFPNGWQDEAKRSQEERRRQYERERDEREAYEARRAKLKEFIVWIYLRDKRFVQTDLRYENITFAIDKIADSISQGMKDIQEIYVGEADSDRLYLVYDRNQGGMLNKKDQVIYKFKVVKNNRPHRIIQQRHKQDTQKTWLFWAWNRPNTFDYVTLTASKLNRQLIMKARRKLSHDPMFMFAGEVDTNILFLVYERGTVRHGATHYTQFDFPINRFEEPYNIANDLWRKRKYIAGLKKNITNAQFAAACRIIAYKALSSTPNSNPISCKSCGYMAFNRDRADLGSSTKPGQEQTPTKLLRWWDENPDPNCKKCGKPIKVAKPDGNSRYLQNKIQQIYRVNREAM